MTLLLTNSINNNRVLKFYWSLKGSRIYSYIGFIIKIELLRNLMFKCVKYMNVAIHYHLDELN